MSSHSITRLKSARFDSLNVVSAAGAKCNGPPGLRPEYFSSYYGAFVLDPEGRNIEAACMRPGFIAEQWGALGWTVLGLTVGVVGGVFGKYMGYL